MNRRSVRSVVVVCLCIAVPARADQVLPRGFAIPEQKVALAGVQLSKALQVDDRKALDDATASVAQALDGVKRWVADHPDQSTPAVARIVIAADKLLAAANRLRALLDQHVDGALIRQAAIDALHRGNELIDAHQGDPVRKEIAMPEALRKRVLAMLERIASDVQPASRAARRCSTRSRRTSTRTVRSLASCARSTRRARRTSARPSASRCAGRRAMKAAIVALAPMNACRDDARSGQCSSCGDLRRACLGSTSSPRTQGGGVVRH
jgi:hypothetical protein